MVELRSIKIMIVSVLFQACKWSNYKIPLSAQNREWFVYVDPSATHELLEELTEEFLTIYKQCPSRLKRKIKASTQAVSVSRSGWCESAFRLYFTVLAYNNYILVKAQSYLYVLNYGAVKQYSPCTLVCAQIIGEMQSTLIPKIHSGHACLAQSTLDNGLTTECLFL
jgi:hypothetical protein